MIKTLANKNAILAKPKMAFFDEKGFTLIELLIVIVIISIISTIAVLSINVNQNKRLEALTNQLVNIFTLAEQEAMLRPATLGFSLTQNQFQFYEYHIPTHPDESPWRSINNKILGKHLISNDIQVTLKIQDKTITNSQPQLIISPSGDITAFKILIGKKNSTPLYQITGEENGAIKSEMLNEE